MFIEIYAKFKHTKILEALFGDIIMATNTEQSECGIIPLNKKTKKIHHLIKAPENYSFNLERKMSWDANEPATVYKTPEMLPDGTTCTAATVILRTKGCHWWWTSGCTFCGYFNDTRDDVNSMNLHAQWAYAKQKLDNFSDSEMIKVYTSGSLFEDREIPVDFQETVLRECHEMGKHLIVESRTEQNTEEKLAWATSINPYFTIAIGLEAYDDEVLKFHINKGFTLKSWHRAVDNIRKYNLRLKTYLMFKPPFMSEGDALVQCAKWIENVASLSDEVSVNPMNIQRGTIIDRIFRSKEYKPPWLWSLVDLIERVNPIIHPGNGMNGDLDQVTRLIIHPTAGGKPRGAHNCGKCDKEVVAAIERYSVSGSLGEFKGLNCSCREIWKEEINLDLQMPIILGCGKNRRSNSISANLSP